MRPLDVVVVGAGPAGLVAALALAKHLSVRPRITVLEIRPLPSPLGGAVILTPNALRCLASLGVLDVIRSRGFGTEVSGIDIFSVHTGQSVGSVDFAGPQGDGYGSPAHKAFRILRADLMTALCEAAAQHDSISIQYGAHVTEILEHPHTVEVTLESNDVLEVDILLGCDGVHSQVRSVIDPSRKPTYTGIAAAIGFTGVDAKQKAALHFTDSSVHMSRRGTLLAGFYEPTREHLYLDASMEAANIVSREGWSAKAADAEAVRKDIASRFAGSAIPSLDNLISSTDDWFLYPVYSLPANGRWSSPGGRILLLGDAAHCMPPQAESTGFTFEDGVLFARLLASTLHTTPESTGTLEAAVSSSILKAVGDRYDHLRRPAIDAALKEAERRWETPKDTGWIKHKVTCFLMPWFLWLSANGRGKSFSEDVSTIKLEV